MRVRVRASGINFADILARMGLYPDAPPLPAVVGYEVAGIVDGVGEGVEGFSDGDRVSGLHPIRRLQRRRVRPGGLRGPDSRGARLRRSGVDPGQLADRLADAGSARQRPGG